MTEKTKNKFSIGDLIRPTEDARKRNKEFTKDRTFVVTGIDYNSIWSDDTVWYDLAAKNYDAATYCLPENEIELIRKFNWD